LGVGLSLVLAIGVAEAVEPFAETPQETAMCSAYIYGGQNKQFKENTEGKDDWQHMHHYCDCVRYRYRALRKISDKHAYRYDLGVAIGGCDYVLDKASRGFYMRPKILVDKGRAQRMLGQPGPAARSFQEAIAGNPREVNAYVELAETQKSMGQTSQAQETLLQGLRHNPGVKLLQQRYRDLGGKEPFPEAVAKPETQREPTAPSPSEVEPPKAPVEVGQEEVPVEQPAGSLGQGCRFCPPDVVQKRWADSFKDQ
jgi:tetratricopeptide (TPR) repeat protein